MSSESSDYAIGGYFQLECMNKQFYHSNAVLLNSGRNALRYIIKTYGIKKLNVPAYTCKEVIESIKLEDCFIQFYNLNDNLLPIDSFSSNEYVLYTNYFGINSHNIKTLEREYQNLIIDNSQSFYSPCNGLASFYSPRKFFGLPDGGFMLGNTKTDLMLEEDYSFERCSHLLMRWDKGAEYSYSNFKINDESLTNQPIKKMSKLTQALMGNIDYENIKQQRIGNFNFLNESLGNSNQMKLRFSDNQVPMVYPYLINNPKIKDKLLKNRIYIAKYWPDIDLIHPLNDYEKYLQDSLLPLPMDQRYDKQDMNRILEVIFG